MKTFSDQVRAVVKMIPTGRVMTYTEVAIAVGNPRAARAVATVMAKNYDPEIPCHRVICSDGHVGGYNRGGQEAKRRLLGAEGVVSLDCYVQL